MLIAGVTEFSHLSSGEAKFCPGGGGLGDAVTSIDAMPSRILLMASSIVLQVRQSPQSKADGAHDLLTLQATEHKHDGPGVRAR